MQIPRLPASGENLKKYLMDTIKAILNYLHASRVRPGYGIDVQETPSGTIISLAKKQTSEASSSSSSGGGTTQNISASVTGNTASVALSGSTSSVEFVGTGGVNISGGTNGQVVLSGSDFPVWGSLVYQQITPTWTQDDMDPYILQYSGFLYITVNPTLYFDPNESSRDIYCYVSVDNKQVFAFQRDCLFESYQGGDVPVYQLYSQDSSIIPVCAGSTITANYYDSSTGATKKLTLALYHI